MLINRNLRFEPNGKEDHNQSTVENLNKYSLKKTELETVRTVYNNKKQYNNKQDEESRNTKAKNVQPVQEIMVSWKYEIDPKHKEFLKLAPTKDRIENGKWVDFNKIYNEINSDGKFRYFCEYADKKEWKRAFRAGIAEEKRVAKSGKTLKYKSLDEKFEKEYEMEFLKAFNDELRMNESNNNNGTKKGSKQRESSHKKKKKKKKKKKNNKNHSPIRGRKSGENRNGISKSILQLPSL